MFQRRKGGDLSGGFKADLPQQNSPTRHGAAGEKRRGAREYEEMCGARADGLVHVPLHRRLESFEARTPEGLLLEVADIQWWPWLTPQPTGRICASALAVA